MNLTSFSQDNRNTKLLSNNYNDEIDNAEPVPKDGRSIRAQVQIRDRIYLLKKLTLLIKYITYFKEGETKLRLVRTPLK